jgi:hypothetical protein
VGRESNNVADQKRDDWAARGESRAIVAKRWWLGGAASELTDALSSSCLRTNILEGGQ